jgi:hypothetical protein
MEEIYNGARIMDRDTYAASIGLAPGGKPLWITRPFEQGEWWQQRSGEWTRVADMSPGHRYNSAAMLMRGAPSHAGRYVDSFAAEVMNHDDGEMAHDALEQMLDEVMDSAFGDPQGWLRGTALYRALTAGLTVHGDGTEPWQKTGRDPATGQETEVPPPTPRACEIPACGCSGEAHP